MNNEELEVLDQMAQGGEYAAFEVLMEDYIRLRSDARALEALRSAGVDNWEGYEEAMELLDE